MSTKPSVPNSLPIGKVLMQAEPLQRLQQRIQESKDRFEAVKGCIPAALLSYIKPGPVDEGQWTLLVSNTAVAAKLRHLQPLMEDALRAHDWRVCSLRIKIQRQDAGAR